MSVMPIRDLVRSRCPRCRSDLRLDATDSSHICVNDACHYRWPEVRPDDERPTVVPTSDDGVILVRDLPARWGLGLPGAVLRLRKFGGYPSPVHQTMRVPLSDVERIEHAVVAAKAERARKVGAWFAAKRNGTVASSTPPAAREDAAPAVIEPGAVTDGEKMTRRLLADARAKATHYAGLAKRHTDLADALEMALDVYQSREVGR